MKLSEIIKDKTLHPPSISVGDEVKVGKWKNRKAEVKGFTTDDHGQPVLKTTKGDQKLFKPRVTKLEPEKKKLDEITDGRIALPITIEKAILLPTARLLPYYRSLRKAIRQGEASYYYQDGSGDAEMREYLSALKAELDNREHIT